MSATRFAAYPPRGQAANVFILVFAFALTFGVLYGGASVVSEYVPWRVVVALPFEERLPFWPAAAALYLTITPLLLLAPFVLRDLDSLLPLFVALMLETVIGAVCFLLLPIDAPAIVCCDDGVSGTFFRIADAGNLDRNYLPSLHVAFSVTLAIAFAPRASQAGRVLLSCWAACIALSTLVTRQHYLLDVLAGVALALWCCYWSTRWTMRDDVRAAFRVELLCLRNFGVFIRRHRRYLVIVAGVLAAGIPLWRRQRLVRTGFAFLQAVDDVLDGDRPSDREPLEVADALIASFDSGEFGNDDLSRLGAAFRSDLFARGGSQSLHIAVALLRSMRRDRQRVLARELLSAPDLINLHRATFRGSLDLMLIAADSPLRANDAPELVDALGWCSTVRDLLPDLAHGLINLPRAVVEAAQTERPGAPLATLPQTRAVQDWLERENARAIALLVQVDVRLAALRERRGFKLLRMFARSIRRYTRR